MKTLAKKINERIKQLTAEDYRLLLYCLGLMIVWKIDVIHYDILSIYYRCSVEDLLFIDRNWLVLTISLMLGFADLFLAYKIHKLVYRTKLKITITDNFMFDIKGLKKLLNPISVYVILISISSIIYDIYYIISKFI